MSNTQFYKLSCIGDMHVGAGSSGFDFIDQLIQRDATTGFPCINGSSLKGALREYTNQLWTGDEGSNWITDIFGTDNARGGISAGDNSQNSKKGKDGFFSAHLVFLPVRTDKVPYVLCTSPSIIKNMIQSVEMLSSTIPSAISNLKSVVDDLESKDLSSRGISLNLKHDNAQTDYIGYKIKCDKSNDVVSLLAGYLETPETDIAIIDDSAMVELCSDLYLPVIARNSLDDGKSINLWYEQYLPRFSVMYFPIIWSSSHKSSMESLFDRSPLQVGGNATVGYGYSKISKL